MIALIMVLCLILLIIGICRDWDEEGMAFLACAFIVGLVICGICGGVIINGRTIQSKIDMYTEENANIEADMDVLVEKYMKYEQDTFGELKGESSITLVSLYPELKADTLVEQQLNVYVENNKKIKELKEKLINISNWKWWLYFGK